MKPARTILKTISGQVVVRPASEDVDHVEISERVSMTLNTDGRRAWDAGEPIVPSRHGDCFMDMKGLDRAEF